MILIIFLHLALLRHVHALGSKSPWCLGGLEALVTMLSAETLVLTKKEVFCEDNFSLLPSSLFCPFWDKMVLVRGIATRDSLVAQ